LKAVQKAAEDAKKLSERPDNAHVAQALACQSRTEAMSGRQPGFSISSARPNTKPGQAQKALEGQEAMQSIPISEETGGDRAAAARGERPGR
jgi:hypothetical protein